MFEARVKSKKSSSARMRGPLAQTLCITLCFDYCPQPISTRKFTGQAASARHLPIPRPKTVDFEFLGTQQRMCVHEPAFSYDAECGPYAAQPQKPRLPLYSPQPKPPGRRRLITSNNFAATLKWKISTIQTSNPLCYSLGPTVVKRACVI